jgi:hypothetical protein
VATAKNVERLADVEEAVIPDALAFDPGYVKNSTSA